MASRPDSARHDPRDRTPPAGGPDGEPTFGDLLNGLTLDSHRPHHRQHRDTHDGEVPVVLGEHTRHRDIPPPPRPPAPEHEDTEDGAPSSAVRAYAWTGGRTTPQYRLELETLLSTTDRYHEHDESVSSESHAVAALCHSPTS